MQWIPEEKGVIDKSAAKRIATLLGWQPKREWVGLTDKDVEEVERWVEFKEEGSGRIPMGKLVRYIGAKLREKNT